MARTGIAIKVSNTVLGSPPKVDSNSMLIVVGATAVTTGAMAFSLDIPYMLQAADDLKTLDITESNNPHVYRQVNDYYAKNAGSILWLVGTAHTNAEVTSDVIVDYVRDTVVQGFQYRPRQWAVSFDSDATETFDYAQLQTAIDTLYNEGFSTVGIIGALRINGAIAVSYNTLPDLSTKAAPMIGTVIVTNRQGDRPCVGFTLGYMASLSVGTSIGDASLPSLGDSFYYIDHNGTGDYINTSCAKVSLGCVNVLGDKQYIFTRTRPPRNGLWFNDGGTAEDATTALSTLEAGRTIASLVDELRSFFTPYINNKIPVNKDGDIQSTYKQVVLDNARSSIIRPYIESGDISDAQISLKARNDDMVGTRTWEVTLAILPAPTLRWIDGYVFYVKSL